MKKIYLLLLMFVATSAVSAQISFDLNFFKKPKAAITMGYYCGGGGWAGFDVEYLASKHIGIQAGAGILSYGMGINYHFNRGGVRSSFVQLGYWHQGFGQRYKQGLIGPTFVYRARRFIQLQGGFGYRVGSGPALDPETTFPFAFMYSVGLYLPIK